MFANLRVKLEYQKDCVSYWVSSNERDIRLELRDVGLREVRQFIVFLQSKKYDEQPLTPVQNQKLSPQTIRAHVETLKAFFTWLYEEEYTPKNKLEKLEWVRLRSLGCSFFFPTICPRTRLSSG